MADSIPALVTDDPDPAPPHERVFLDKGGRPLGIITDSSARTLPPGASAGWQTDSSSPPISAKDVGAIQVFTIVQ